ncbi:hypothetical protein CLF_105964 [Clonorchis sinensis]|uniref:Uncharacterized protein n=1 Tax=Clonorchis sinensis TaxID=79923 RepID=G7YPK9_CLOSI|nr:hypothetical protein CLF_105964 [Clonorchis sinensis]
MAQLIAGNNLNRRHDSALEWSAIIELPSATSARPIHVKRLAKSVTCADREEQIKYCGLDKLTTYRCDIFTRKIFVHDQQPFRPVQLRPRALPAGVPVTKFYFEHLTVNQCGFQLTKRLEKECMESASVELHKSYGVVGKNRCEFVHFVRHFGALAFHTIASAVNRTVD